MKLMVGFSNFPLNHKISNICETIACESPFFVQMFISLVKPCLSKSH